MKNEEFNNLNLIGDLEPVFKDQYFYRVSVEPKNIKRETDRLFTEITSITGMAITVKHKNRFHDPTPDLEKRTFSKAKARITSALYEHGKEYHQEITVDSLNSGFILMEDDQIQERLLTALANQRKSNPLDYQGQPFPNEGFCQIIGIPIDQFYFNVSLLIEENLLKDINISSTPIEDGYFYITSSGIRSINQIKKESYEQHKNPTIISESNINEEFQYDIVISFAGEDRKIAESIANKLNESGARVFYDNFEEENLWGKNLYEYLTKVYSESARFCVMLLSKNYANKSWTTLERQSAQARAFREQNEYILPIRLDNTAIPGLHETIGYISFENTGIDKIVELIIRKLKQSNLNAL